MITGAAHIHIEAEPITRRSYNAAGAGLGLGTLAGAAAAQRRPAEIIAGALSAPDLALINGRLVDYRGVAGDTLLLANGRIVAAIDQPASHPRTTWLLATPPA